MILLSSIVLLQALQTAPAVSHSVAIDPQHTLFLIGGHKMDYNLADEYQSKLVFLNPGERLRLAISEKSGPTWDLGEVGIGEMFARVARVDRSSVVIEIRESGYGISQPSLKFFFDLTTRKVLKRITFDPSMTVSRLQLIDNRVCASVTAGETESVSCGDEVKQTIVGQPGPAAKEENVDPPIQASLPQSTYDQFARARPERVLDGYARNSMSIPRQVVHPFRSKSSTDSDSSRPVIPIESVHRFRREADHFFGAVGIGGRHVGIVV